MAHGADCAAECAGVVKNFHHTGLATCEELIGSAIFRTAIDFTVHPVLSFRPRGDSQFVSLFSSLHAAPLGWNCTIARGLSRREETRRLPPLVCPMVRAHAL